jgi:glycosyltransferase involved in cell wall biosynthesis
VEKHLHIISHDVPYPVDYGGVFDIYYKIRALKEKGVSIYLHCYDYGRGRQPELNKYCTEVHYYNRNEGHKGFSTNTPYIVSSRQSEAMVESLLRDEYPILAEGIHCTFFLDDDRFKNRKIFLRLHNVEYEYYHHLFKHSHSLFKKAYYYNESRMLKHYESRIADKLPIIAVAQKDINLYQKKFGASKIWPLPVFVGWDKVKAPEGRGSYCLYHGNLSVAENEKAAIWLLENIFNELPIPFVIAGKNPGNKLERIAHQQMHTCLVANPSDNELSDLIQKAQINILPSFNETGVKLKLINALFNGRHCVVNAAAVEETGLAEACSIAENEITFKTTIQNLYEKPLTVADKEKRCAMLHKQFNNVMNAEKLIAWIW